jgi:hypothetical protein
MIFVNKIETQILNFCWHYELIKNRQKTGVMVGILTRNDEFNPHALPAM